jgi:hypothetical protein
MLLRCSTAYAKIDLAPGLHVSSGSDGYARSNSRISRSSTKKETIQLPHHCWADISLERFFLMMPLLLDSEYL